MSDETTTHPTHVQCEPAGTVYCDDYEAIVGPKPDTEVEASTIATTKVVRPKKA